MRPGSWAGTGATVLLRAALPAVPVVNLLPGIRKSGRDDLADLPSGASRWRSGGST